MSKDIRMIILRKLKRRGYIGGRHTSVANLPKGLPPDRKGEAKSVVEELIREELLNSKPTHDGLHVSLNPRMMGQINKIISGDSE